MFVSVDKIEAEKVEGFQYTNKKGSVERVEFRDNWVTFTADGSSTSSVYYEDIPKVIKALQASYDMWKAGQT